MAVVQIKINAEIHKISEWLKLNKLSLNINKTKYIFQMPNKKVIVPTLVIGNSTNN